MTASLPESVKRFALRLLKIAAERSADADAVRRDTARLAKLWQACLHVVEFAGFNDEVAVEILDLQDLGDLNAADIPERYRAIVAELEKQPAIGWREGGR